MKRPMVHSSLVPTLYLGFRGASRIGMNGNRCVNCLKAEKWGATAASLLTLRKKIPSAGSLCHRFLHQLVGGFGEQRVGGFPIDRLAADLQQRRHRERRHARERLM